MTLLPITYRGKLVACASATRCILSDELDRRPAGDPETTFVIYMCAYLAATRTVDPPKASR